MGYNHRSGDLCGTGQGRRTSKETENWELEGLRSGKSENKNEKTSPLVKYHSNEEPQLKCPLVPQSGGQVL